MNEYCYAEIQIGQKESFQIKISPEMEDSFRNMSGDVNPMHRDDAFAQSISTGNYQQHVVFGMLTASLCSTLAGVYLPGKYSLIHSFDELSFLRPVFSGDTLTVTGEVTDKIDALNLILVKVIIKNHLEKTVVRARMKILVLQ